MLRRPEVTAAIVGSRSPAQIAQTVVAGSRTLDTASIDEVDKLLVGRDQQLASLEGVTKARV